MKIGAIAEKSLKYRMGMVARKGPIGVQLGAGVGELVQDVDCTSAAYGFVVLFGEAGEI